MPMPLVSCQCHCIKPAHSLNKAMFNEGNLCPDDETGKFTYSRHTLQTLYLVHVMLREIPPGLKDLSALQNLYLSYNPISAASNDVFQGRIASSLRVR